MIQRGYSTVSQKRRAGGRKPHAVFSPTVRQAPPNPPTFDEVPPEPQVNASPAAVNGDLEALIDPPQVESHILRREVEDRSIWDEASPSMPAQSPMSWQRTVMGAAIGALERVALGGHDRDKGGDRDDAKNAGDRYLGTVAPK